MDAAHYNKGKSGFSLYLWYVRFVWYHTMKHAVGKVVSLYSVFKVRHSYQSNLSVQKDSIWLMMSLNVHYFRGISSYKLDVISSKLRVARCGRLIICWRLHPLSSHVATSLSHIVLPFFNTVSSGGLHCRVPCSCCSFTGYDLCLWTVPPLQRCRWWTLMHQCRQAKPMSWSDHI